MKNSDGRYLLARVFILYRNTYDRDSPRYLAEFLFFFFLLRFLILIRGNFMLRKVIFSTYFLLLHIGSNLNATKDFPSWKVRSAKREWEISHRCSEVIRRSFLLRSSFSAVGSHPRWEEVDLIPGDKFSSRSAGNALPDFDSVQCSSSTFETTIPPTFPTKLGIR